MIFFHIRAWIEKQYIAWINENNVRDCPLSVITFLAIKGYINEEKVLEEYKKEQK